jgi:hypothetical protein
MAPHWKCGSGQPVAGSNPALSATARTRQMPPPKWAGDPTPLEGRSGAPDVEAYDRSIARLRALDSKVVRFGHDRTAWTR